MERRRSRQEPTSAKCAGCRETFPRREQVTVHPERHDGLHYFDGDKICKSCARRSAVEV
jgi:hypothetical protein